MSRKYVRLMQDERSEIRISTIIKSRIEGKHTPVRNIAVHMCEKENKHTKKRRSLKITRIFDTMTSATTTTTTTSNETNAQTTSVERGRKHDFLVKID